MGPCRGDLIPPGLGYPLPPVGSTQVILKSVAGFPGPGQLHTTPPQAESCEQRCWRSPKSSS